MNINLHKYKLFNKKKGKALFVLKYDVYWLGGLYYKTHLIRALRSINSRIPIIVYTEFDNLAKVNEILANYDVEVRPFDRPIPKGLGRLELFFRRRIGKSFIGLADPYLPFGNSLFDYSDTGILRACPGGKRIYWVPDLQDLFLPDLFSVSVLKARNKRYSYIAKHANQIVFSSYDSWESFKRFFPSVLQRNVKIHILRFAVFHPVEQPEISYERLISLGLLNQKYFIVSNQFMAHKNHSMVIEALFLLKNRHGSLGFKMVFTGQTHDPRNPDYFLVLKDKIYDSGLENDILITGVLDRVEQLALLRNSLAIVQPSNFEGWNSTVEDAKLLNANLICSDISIHKEQLEGYPALFFQKGDANQLAEFLFLVYLNGFEGGQSTKDYKLQQLSFARQLELLFV